MKKNEIHFIGFLANFDAPNSSVLNIKLEKGFEIRCDSLQRIARLVSKLDNSTSDLALIKLIDAGINSYVATPDADRYVYYIYNSFTEESEHEKYIIHEYLMHLISIMRLFKEGDVSIPLEYQFYYKNEVPILDRMALGPRNNSRIRFTLEHDEIPKLQEFLQFIKLPFEKKYLKLALDNYQLSYDVHHPSLQFLTLMNCMEVLFSPSDRDELRYRISRNLAVLLGENMDDSEEIFKKMRDFYDKRSKIVHKGESDVSRDDILHLRGLTRESIKEFYRINKGRDELLELLHTHGFGHPPEYMGV